MVDFKLLQLGLKMKKVITQHCTVEQQDLFDISRPINEAYAKKMGFEYIIDSVRRCPERSIYWEKIAWLRDLLPRLEDGSLVVWEDADSANIVDEDFCKALPTGGILGMVQNRAGIDCKQLINWYNAGVIVMKNCDLVRNFFDRVWIRTEETDEEAMMGELRENGWIVGDGIKISSLEPKWNCWINNAHICSNVVVQSWHGMKFEDKLPAVKKFFNLNPLV